MAGGDLLVRLVDDLLADADDLEIEVLIADNGLAASVRSELSERTVQLVDMDGNRGFGPAVNRAADHAAGRFLVLVNDDVVALPGMVRALTAPLAAGAAMSAGVLLRDEDPSRIESAGLDLDAGLNGFDYLAGELIESVPIVVPAPVGPCGGLAGYERRAFEAAGRFDEGLFAYYEDVDLALRIRANGGTCVVATTARARHAGSSTLGRASLRKARIVATSRGYLVRKYGVLSNLRRAVVTLALEVIVCSVLIARHRSIAPVTARIAGWRACTSREPYPSGELTRTGAIEGLRRRRARARHTRQVHGTSRPA